MTTPTSTPDNKNEEPSLKKNTTAIASKRRSTGRTVSTCISSGEYHPNTHHLVLLEEPKPHHRCGRGHARARAGVFDENNDDDDNIEESFHTARSTHAAAAAAAVETVIIPQDPKRRIGSTTVVDVDVDDDDDDLELSKQRNNNNNNAVTTSAAVDDKMSSYKYITTNNDVVLRKWILFVYSIISVTFVAGIVYGFPALRLQLKQEGSTLTETQYGAIFTSASFCAKGGRMIFGYMRDRYGTKLVALLTLGCTMFGSLGIAYSPINNVVAIGTSVSLLSLGTGLQLVLQPVGGLFPKHNNAIVSTLSGSFQLSALVLLTLAAIAKSSTFINKSHVYTGYAILVAFLSILAYMLLPNGSSFVVITADDNKDDDTTNKQKETINNVITLSISKDLTASSNDDVDDFEPHVPVSSSSSTNTEDEEDIDINIDEEKGRAAITATTTINTRTKESSNVTCEAISTTTTRSLMLSCKEQICSLEYISLLIWFSISLIPLQYYLGSIGYQLEQKGDTTGKYTYIFSIIYSCTAITAPIGGLLSDKIGLGLTQGFATTLCSISFFMLSSTKISLDSQIIGLVLYSLGRLLTFSMFFSNVGSRFGYNNFGTLTGLGLLISAMVSIAQFPLISIVVTSSNDTKSELVNIISGIALLCLLPYCIWLHITQRQKPFGATTLL